MNGRKMLFTPLNVAGGPNAEVEVGAIRTTIGKYMLGGRFTKVDRWKDVKDHKRKLQSEWQGVTVFSDKPLPEEAIDYFKSRDTAPGVMARAAS